MKSNSNHKLEQDLIKALTKMDTSSRVKLSAYSLSKKGDHLLVTRRPLEQMTLKKEKVTA